MVSIMKSLNYIKKYIVSHFSTMELVVTIIVATILFYISFRFKKWKKRKILKGFEKIKIKIKNIKKKRYGYIVYSEIGVILDDFKESIKRISEILDIEITEVERVKQGVFKLLTHQVPEKTKKITGDLEKLGLGVEKNGSVMSWRLYQENLIHFAPTRSGKSVFAFSVLLQFKEVYKNQGYIIICDYKNGADFSYLKKKYGGSVKIFNPSSDLDLILEELELYERLTTKANELRATHGADNDGELFKRGLLNYTPVLWFWDEVERYMTTAGCDKETAIKRKSLIKKYNDFNGMLASSAVFSFSATQSPKVSDLKFQLNNITGKILGKTSKESLRFMGIDSTYANRSDFKHGKFLFTSLYSEPTVIRTDYRGTNKDFLNKKDI